MQGHKKCQTPSHNLQAPQPGWTLDSTLVVRTAKLYLPQISHLCLDPEHLGPTGKAYFHSRADGARKGTWPRRDMASVVILPALHPQGDQQEGIHRPVSLVVSEGGRAQVS